jgi:methylamine dehydrogenase heavy chain
MGFSRLLAGLLIAPWCLAQIEPEAVGTSQLGQPQPTWFIARDGLGPAYVFDAATGEMQGLLSLSPYTPAAEVNRARGEIYAAESYYSRATRGERTDVVTIYDMSTLAARSEIKVPNKIASLPFRQYIGLLDDGKHLAVFNMTPAQSVTLVNVASEEFVGEISTPGCALIMPVANRSFLQICGDGTLQLLRFDRQGQEAERLRSSVFFDIRQDPVFDKPVATVDGWLLTSYLGQVREVSVEGDDIVLSDPWSLLSDEELAAGWRPGGGQLVSYHQGLDLLFVLMNPQGEFAHDSSGTEIWVYNRGSQRRVQRVPIDYRGTDLLVASGAEPSLIVTGEDRLLHVLDVATMVEVRTIAEVGIYPGFLQAF